MVGSAERIVCLVDFGGVCLRSGVAERVGKWIGILIAPWLIAGRFRVLARNVQAEVAEGLFESGIVVFALAPAFFERTLQPLLLAAVVLEHLIPKRLDLFRVGLGARDIVVWKRHRGMLGRALQNAMDLGGDAFDVAGQN